MGEATDVTVYTDGACTGNPGPGGYAAILIRGGQRSELSGGRRLTTNNRMEMMAAIAALSSLEGRCRVLLYSDSRLMVDAIEMGAAQRWRANGWRRSRNSFVANADLWRELLPLCNRHEVRFEWVQGHAGHPENERCDWLAVTAARVEGLPADVGYEEQRAREASQPTLF